MLDLDKIQHISRSYSSQELFASLVWQRQFNNFDGKQVIRDLSSHPNLWHSFLFSQSIYAPDKEGLSFACMITTLLAMANYRVVPETSMIKFVAYPADTLYVLTENRSTMVSELVDLGKKWQADSVDIVDSNNEEYSGYVQFRLRESLAEKDKSLLSQSNLERLDAVVVAYWWD